MIGGQKSTTEAGRGVGDDDADEDEEDVSSRRGEIPVKSSTLFIDGISHLVGYAQIQALFAQIGRLGKVFVQQHRKIGRRFRFGFLRFLARAHADAALARLNGVKLGGFHLSMTVARFPRVRGSSSRDSGSGALGRSQKGTEVGVLKPGT